MIENLNYLIDKSVLFALIVAVLIALCAGLLGVVLVLKRCSMIGDGLSHVAFGAYAVAIAMKLIDNMLLTIPVTIIIAILLLRVKSDGKIKGETLIAMLSTGALALGYVVMNVSGGNNISGDVCSTLFGGATILCLTVKDVIVTSVLSVVVFIIFFLFYNKFFAVTFDEGFAKAIGVKTEIYKLLLAITTAVVIVLSMELVGALLISALIVFPAISAMKLTGRFKGVIAISLSIAGISAAVGVIAACLSDAPIGSTIVLVNMAIFIVTLLVSFVMSTAKSRN